MTYWKAPSFKELQRAWYQRLREDGFLDAEEMVGEEMVLKQTAAHGINELDETRSEAKESYYRLLSQKVQEIEARIAEQEAEFSLAPPKPEYRSSVDRLILISYAEGKGAVEICEMLKERGIHRHRHAIRFTVRHYEELWGLRKYTPAQLGKKGLPPTG